MRRQTSTNFWVFALCVFCILVGWAIAHCSADEVKSEWQLLSEELHGEPDKATPEELAAAMLGAMLQHPGQTAQLFHTCVVISCNRKDHPKRAVVMMTYAACQLYPALGENFLKIAREVCPLSGAHEKVVLPKTDEEEDLTTPLNFAGLTPPPDIYGPVTPCVDVRPKN